MDVNAVFFSYAKLPTGEKILARTVLADEASSPVARKRITLAEVLKLADDRRIRGIVDICRRMRDVWDEGPSATHGASIVYSLQTPNGRRGLFGLNVSGEKMKTPAEQLNCLGCC